jgi:hypothetical protein
MPPPPPLLLTPCVRAHVRSRDSLRRGGYFGRSTRTDVVLASLEPRWSEARKPLSYLGVRSELENEVLRLRVYDWDALSSDDLIGTAEVPDEDRTSPPLVPPSDLTIPAPRFILW